MKEHAGGSPGVEQQVILQNVRCFRCGDTIVKYIGLASFIECANCRPNEERYLAITGAHNTQPSVPIADIQYKGAGPLDRRYSWK